MIDPVTTFLLGTLVFLVVLLAIAVSNLRAVRPLSASLLPRVWPRVSVLVPARNEAGRIEPCLASLLAQDYPRLEVIALDDESDDDTLAILQALAKRDSRLRVLRGEPLPDGWRGKSWACHQLAQAAGGEILFFTDADTIHGPSSVRLAVASLLSDGADLLSALPRQRMPTWGERLLVPVLPWSLLSFFPMWMAQRLRLRWLAMAVGQAMIFPAPSYRRVGGHAAVRQEVAEDLALARRVQALGGRWQVRDATAEIECRMYPGLRESLDGFGKNLYAAFGFRPLLYLFIWIWLPVAFVLPLLLAFGEVIAGIPHPDRWAITGLSAVAALLLWGLTAWKARLPIAVVPLFPLIIVTASGAAFRSFVLHLRQRATWKGRRLLRPAT